MKNHTQFKPIEEGCLALIIKSKAGNSGEVRVGKYIGVVPEFFGGDYWEVDRPVRTLHGNIDYCYREAWLMRIDGEEFVLAVRG